MTDRTDSSAADAVAEAPRRRDVEQLFVDAAAPLAESLVAETRDTARRLFGSRDAEAAPFVEGDHVGPYRIGSLLGAGGQGWVYEAEHRQIARRVALKIPRKDVASRLLDEARIAAKIDHPRIVRVEDIRDDADVPYLVLELCTGGSLETLLDDHPDGLPVERVAQIATAVLEALGAIHDKGVVHRDVKPGNVLFMGDGELKLSDLGIGTVATSGATLEHSMAKSITSGQMIAGTPLFMAPEQENPDRLGGEGLDGRADLFAFGKLLFVLLTGASPATIRPPSRLREGLDPAWDDLIFRLVEEDRSRRFADAAEVAAAVRAIVDAAEAKKKPDGDDGAPLEPARPLSSRRAAAMAAAAERRRAGPRHAGVNSAIVAVLFTLLGAGSLFFATFASGADLVYLIAASIGLLGTAAITGAQTAGYLGGGRPRATVFSALGSVLGAIVVGGALAVGATASGLAADGAVWELQALPAIGMILGPILAIGFAAMSFVAVRARDASSETAEARTLRLWSRAAAFLLAGAGYLLLLPLVAYDVSDALGWGRHPDGAVAFPVLIAGLTTIFGSTIAWNLTGGAWALRPKMPRFAAVGTTALCLGLGLALAVGLTAPGARELQLYGLERTQLLEDAGRTILHPDAMVAIGIGAALLSSLILVGLFLRWRRLADEAQLQLAFADDGSAVAPLPTPRRPRAAREGSSRRKRAEPIGAWGVVGRIFAVIGGLLSVATVTIVAFVGFFVVVLAAGIRGCSEGGDAALTGGEVGVIVALLSAVVAVTVGVFVGLIKLFRARSR